jgi:hypothetical protein
MDKQIRQIVKQVINENFGVWEVANNIAKWLAPNIIKRLQFDKENNYIDFSTDTDTITTLIPEQFRAESGIWQINTIVSNLVYKSGDAKVVEAVFLKSKTRSNTIHNRVLNNITIELKLNWDFKTDINTVIYSALSHEFHHILDFMTKRKKESKTNSFNFVYNYSMTKMPDDLLNNHPELLDFLHHFYLSIPQEVNAKVHEAFAFIDTHLDLSESELMDILSETQPLQDIKSMNNYNINDVLLLSPNILIEFINLFNQNIKAGLNRSGFKDQYFNFVHQNTKDFFSYWKKRINYEGDKAFRKITKMVAKKKELNEISMLYDMDRTLLNEILPYKLFEFDFKRVKDIGYDVDRDETQEDILWNSLMF